MLQGFVVVGASFAYLGLLFAIAYYADQRADRGRSVIANPYVYSLSLAVYATAWTFYGSVGRAAVDGVGFLPIYIGPTLMIALWWIVMRKILRISKANRITSLADFIASRYGKSALIGGVVTIIAVIGILPYISLQLKAVSNSFTILMQYPDIVMPAKIAARPLLQDTALWVALILAIFTILFGTRHLDAAEHHEGMVAAIAFESLVKLLAFLAIGVFVTFGIYRGFGDVFGRAAADPALAPMLSPLDGVAGGYASWVWLTILSMLAIMFLPRQFQVAVIENKDERYLDKAIWVFPLYMLAINVFVLPIAFGGRLHFPGGSVDADTYVLTLPMAERQELLALLVYIGGLSAATGMVIVETIALSTMVCNDLVMPVLLRLRRLRLAERPDLTGLLLAHPARRDRVHPAARLPLLPARGRGLRAGVDRAHLVRGGRPVRAGGVRRHLLEKRHAPRRAGGPAVRLRRLGLHAAAAGPRALRLAAREPARGGAVRYRVAEAAGAVRARRPRPDHPRDDLEHGGQRRRLRRGVAGRRAVGGRASAGQPVRRRVPARGRRRREVLARHRFGARSATRACALPRRGGGRRGACASTRGHAAAWPDERIEADADFVHFVEVQLGGAIGSASARIMVAQAVKEQALTLDEVREILDEASQVVVYSHRLEQKSRELEAATAELRAANEQLKELDRLKDDFMSTITHELRTPLTSIRAFSEILHSDPTIAPAQRTKFVAIIMKETERLTRLINQVLDLAKIESGRADWRVAASTSRQSSPIRWPAWPRCSTKRASPSSRRCRTASRRSWRIWTGSSRSC